MEINMLTRFKQNVRTYPRTAAVLGAVYVLAAVIAVTVARHQLVALLGAVLIVGFFDFLTYIWVMSDSRRLSVLLETLDTFEGRTTTVADEDDDEDSENCGDPDCDECNPKNLWNDEEGQDIAEYAVMLAVMLVIVIGTIRLIGGSAGNVFSSIGSQIGQ
jgi:Flp pilus assembly pilin Flp